jgi:hypothetical protein
MKIGEILAHPKDLKTKDFKSILSPKNPKKSDKSQAYVKNRVDYLVAKYKAPGYESLFRRAVWRLDEAVINRIVAASEGKGSPRGYFATSVKNEDGYN